MTKPQKFTRPKGSTLTKKTFKFPTDIIDMIVQMQKIDPRLSATDIVKAGVRSEYRRLMEGRDAMQ